MSMSEYFLTTSYTYYGSLGNPFVLSAHEEVVEKLGRHLTFRSLSKGLDSTKRREQSFSSCISHGIWCPMSAPEINI